jgi:hypothetical protein
MGQQASKQQRATAKKAADIYHEAAMEAAAGGIVDRGTGSSREQHGALRLTTPTAGATSSVQRSLERNGLPFVKDELIAINRFIDPSADIGLLQSMTTTDLRKLIRSNIVLKTIAAGESPGNARGHSATTPTSLLADSSSRSRAPSLRSELQLAPSPRSELQLS